MYVCTQSLVRMFLQMFDRGILEIDLTCMWEAAGIGKLTISLINTLANIKFGIVTSMMLCSVPRIF